MIGTKVRQVHHLTDSDNCYELEAFVIKSTQTLHSTSSVVFFYTTKNKTNFNVIAQILDVN